ncbi:MAG: NFACT family protein, partial [Synergistaceae bacterium]|nr:NFACT family protein [Synergistaceae bacterium]
FKFRDAKILSEQNILDAARHGVIEILLNKGREKILRDIKAAIKKAVKSRERHRDGLIKQLKECEMAEIFKIKGELILANIYNIKPRAESIIVDDWSGNKIEIELDANLSPSRNAEKYFKKYKKFNNNPDLIREKIFEIESAINEINEQPSILESISGENNFNNAVRDLKEWLFPEEFKFKINKSKSKNNKALPPHLEFNLENNVSVLVGLSARGNRYVTFKLARPDDIWLHAHELPGSHVIIKGASRLELEAELDNILKFAAQLAAWYSKGRTSGLVLVDYTERRHVRAVPGTVALVTYVNPGTIRVKPDDKPLI